jgi:phosphatidylglycerol:prolipoprotein diacylglycerol transferase
VAGTAGALFLVGYGTLRFIAEFARQPDDFLGLLPGKLSMGQWLSLPMIVVGLVMMVVLLRRAGRQQAPAR